MAENREYQSMKAEFQMLNTQMLDLTNRMQQTFNNIATTGMEIQKNIATIDGMTNNVFNGNSKRDLRAMQYLDDMERRAKERLLKYHYYMGKAYEYRLLQPYTAELNLSAIVECFTSIAEANPTQPVLNSQDFQNLKAVYEEQLSTVTANILNLYNSNRSELSVPVRFSMAQEDLTALNNGVDINLNIFERGMIPPYEENVRIVRFKIHDIQVHLEGDQSSFAYFDLLMEHSGRSMMRDKGEIYWFDHINNQTINPVTWGIRYDANNGIVNIKEPSYASQSLLYSLLTTLNAQDSIMIYSRPGAWSDIRISKNDVTSGNTKMVIDNLTFELQYDFVQRPNNNRNLDVYAADIDNSNMTLSPYTAISRADKSGRDNGRGTLYRTYNRNTTTNVEVPEEYGRYKFVNWVNRYDEVISTQPQISITLDNDKFVKANYKYMGPVLVLTDSVLVGKDAGEVEIKIENSGSEEMEWSAESNTPWLSIISADEGIDTEYLVLKFQENSLGVKREGSITVTAPETAEYQKTLRIVQSNESLNAINTLANTTQQPNIFLKNKNTLSIQLPEFANKVSIDVFSLNGQLVLRDYRYNSSAFDVSLSHCSSGIYIAKIIYDGKNYARKLVK
jgi:hypothetical protein